MFSTGSLPLLPCLLLSILTQLIPGLVFTTPMMRMIRALWQTFEKNGLNYPMRRGYVSPCCAAFITVMFTFISTCLKCDTISPLPVLQRRLLLISAWLQNPNRCYQAKKMFCLLSIKRSPGPSQDFTCQSAQKLQEGELKACALVSLGLKGSIHPNTKQHIVLITVVSKHVETLAFIFQSMEIHW